MKKSLRDPRTEELGLHLVQCPRQPGRLTISSQSCAERYNLAQREDHRFPKDEFGVALMSGLKTCKSCPDGQYFWRNKDWPHLPRRLAGGKRCSRASRSQGGNRGNKDHWEQGW